MSPHSAAPDPTPDFDGVWKEALQSWLPECMSLFWPAIHARIDWSVPPAFLHQELQRLHQVARHGARRTDLLVRLRLCDGTMALLLVHLEIQAGRVGVVFCRRMFHYRIMLCGKYPEQPILSCAILLDHEPDVPSLSYVQGGYGDTLTFEFPVMTLAGWRHRVAELEMLAPVNPFAVIVLAQLEVRAAVSGATRLAGKLRLARALKQWAYGPVLRGAVFRLIDSLLVLPPHLDARFIEILEQSEDSAMLEQLSSIDRYLLKKEKDAGMEEGRLAGAVRLLQGLLQRRFGTIPEWAAERIAQADADTVQQWALRVLDARRLEDIFDT